MNSVIFQETAKLKKPVPAEKVIELSENYWNLPVIQKDILQDYIKRGEQ